MSIFYVPYSLRGKADFSGVHIESEGLLLKFLRKTGEESFSVYHPILSLGDLSLEDFLRSEEKRNFLIKRIEKLSICADEKLKGRIQSYYLASSEADLLKNADKITKSGFKTVKLKTDVYSNINFNLLMKMPFDFILDFNGRERLETFLDSKGDARDFLKKKVRYIEDPFAENQMSKTVLNFKIASDFIDYGSLASYKIVKPTGFNHFDDTVFGRSNLVVTSYLDHPLGQLLSAKWAFEQKVSNPCGLWTHTLYESNAYSELFAEPGLIDLSLKDDFISLLKKEDWKAL